MIIERTYNLLVVKLEGSATAPKYPTCIRLGRAAQWPELTKPKPECLVPQYFGPCRNISMPSQPELLGLGIGLKGSSNCFIELLGQPEIYIARYYLT